MLLPPGRPIAGSPESGCAQPAPEVISGVERQQPLSSPRRTHGRSCTPNRALAEPRSHGHRGRRTRPGLGARRDRRRGHRALPGRHRAARAPVRPALLTPSGSRSGSTGAPARRSHYGRAMRSIATVFCLSLLAVVLLAGSAQARTVKGCVIKHHTSCDHKDLHGKDLHGAVLHHSVLHHINLRNVDLRGADLSYADLREADLRGANLRGANLKGAKLHYYTAPKKNGARALQRNAACSPKCVDANLTSIPLQGPYADVACSQKCVGANLTGANLTGTNLTGATGCGSVTPAGLLNGRGCAS